MTTQLDLLSPHPPFGGRTYVRERDGSRLADQLAKVREAVSDGQWRTLHALAERVGAPEASVSARLRDLRKPQFGGLTVERRYVGNGLYEYRVGK